MFILKLALTIFLIAAPVTWVSAQFTRPEQQLPATAFDLIFAASFLATILSIALSILGLVLYLWSA